VKTKETRRTAELNEVVSSQYESYEDDDYVDNNEDGYDDDVDDYDDDDEAAAKSWQQADNNLTIASQSNSQTPLSSSSSLSSSAWSNSAVSGIQRRRRRKPAGSSRRRHCEPLSNNSDRNKPRSRDVASGRYGAITYQPSAAAACQQDSLNYFTGADQQRMTVRPQQRQNDTHYDLQQTADEPYSTLAQYQLDCDVIRPGRYDHQATAASYYDRQTELRDELLNARTVDDQAGSHAALHATRHGDGFTIAQYYGHDEIQYTATTRPGRDHGDRINVYSRHGDDTCTTQLQQYYREVNPRQLRDREQTNSSQYYRLNELQSAAGLHAGMEEDGSEFSRGKTTEQQYANRYGEVTSSVSQRTAPFHAHSVSVPVKISPYELDSLEQDRDSQQALMIHADAGHSLPALSTSAVYWPNGGSVESMKDVVAWRPDELTDAKHRQSVSDLRAAKSPLVESCNLATNFIKVEDSLNGQEICHAVTPASVAVSPTSSSSSSLFSSSSAFSAEDHVRRDLLAQRNVVGEPKPRRRRRHNASAAGALASRDSHRLHQLSFSSPSSSTSPAGPAAAAAASTLSSASTSISQLSTKLPFSLPPVPAGYRLVITHRPTPECSDDSSQVTQLIIDHPSDSTTLIHSNTGSLAQLRTATDPLTPTPPPSAASVCNHSR